MTCHWSRSNNDLSIHARIDSSGFFDDRNRHAAIFEVKFRKKTESAAKESRERSAQQLFADLKACCVSCGKAATSVPLRIPLSLQQDASMTPRRGNL